MRIKPLSPFALIVACSPLAASCDLGPTGMDDDVDYQVDPVQEDVTSGDVYAIKAVHSGLCLNVAGDDETVNQAACTGGTNQQWRFRNTGGGAYEISVVGGGKCLDVDNFSTANGAKVHVWNCNGAPNQRWKLLGDGGGQNELIAVHSGSCADIAGVSLDPGALLQQWKCAGNDNQLFTFSPTTGQPDPGPVPDPSPEPDPQPGPSSGQGPVASGRVTFSQDFESGLQGMGRSPSSLPADRVALVNDPLGQRGRVARIVWKHGDNYRTTPSTLPRSWLSSRAGSTMPLGTKISYAFGYMTTSSFIGASFAQFIRTNGPIWMLQGGADGNLRVVCNRQCNGTPTTAFKLQPNKWYDFRVEFTYANGGGGSLLVTANGQKVYERHGLGLSDAGGTAGHWDGGIYLTQAGIGGPTRTVYISNLSIGKR